MELFCHRICCNAPRTRQFVCGVCMSYASVPACIHQDETVLGILQFSAWPFVNIQVCRKLGRKRCNGLNSWCCDFQYFLGGFDIAFSPWAWGSVPCLGFAFVFAALFHASEVWPAITVRSRAYSLNISVFGSSEKTSKCTRNLLSDHVGLSKLISLLDLGKTVSIQFLED